MTLTKDVSEDTIIFLTCIMFILQVAFSDYYTGELGISINFSMFATVLIASRLESHLLVTELMMHSVLCFVLIPLGVEKLRERKPHINVLISPTLFMLDCFLFDSQVLLIAFVIGNLLMNVVGPTTMVYVQRYKTEIRGPWDEAVIDLYS